MLSRCIMHERRVHVKSSHVKRTITLSFNVVSNDGVDKISDLGTRAIVVQLSKRGGEEGGGKGGAHLLTYLICLKQRRYTRKTVSLFNWSRRACGVSRAHVRRRTRLACVSRCVVHSSVYTNALGTRSSRCADLDIDSRPARGPIGRRVATGGDVA